MIKAMPYILTGESITLMIDSAPVTVTISDPYWEEIISAVRNRDWDTAVKLANKPAVVKDFGKGHLEIKNDAVYYKGTQIHNYVVGRIFDFINEGLDVEPLVNFMNKLMENPSKHCVDELLEFLEHGNMPVDADGDFYAYKAVTSDWMDKHSQSIRNMVGDVVSVTRNQVDDNSDHACSMGLHAGSLQYVKGFGDTSDRLILVKINPKDVVSVPKHDTSKLRCCRYTVVGVYTGILPDTIYDCDEDDIIPDDECNPWD